MTDTLRRTGNILGKLNTLALWLAGAGLVLMTGFVAWQVFCRYVLNDSPSWTEPGSVMLMSWFIFLGAAVGVRENYHLGFDVLLYVLPKGGKKWLRMISDLVVFAFGVGMIWYGGQLIALHLGHHAAVARHLRRLGLCAAGGRRRAGLPVLAGAHRAAPVRRADRRCSRRVAAGRSRRRTRRSRHEGLTRWNSGSSSASSRC